MFKLYIPLNEFLESYLRKETSCVKGDVILTRDNVFGRFIDSCTLWQPIKPEVNEGSVPVFLRTSHEMHREWNFPYLTKEREKLIQDFIQSYFNLTLDLFFAKGYRQSYRQKDIISAFMYYYNLPDTLGTYEMIKQRDFRKRKNIKKIITKNILNL